ncbi:hypothetical protein CNMCM7691_006743 [Aspergillus felis]|uniref:Nucleoside phosphorylase domain-containing protein n=1 Tax=Aspergillus felis TaxID=1287682 RepID=A0A8H6V8T1_9EURO|nr:hypothetical protein CNMCM7691_006743 [Aspergillus felis]
MATPARSPFTNEEYTVGWICALAVELAAAKGMMDKVHGEPQTPPAEADNNSYILGSMGSFNVVAARLPIHQVGSSSATAVAKEMLFTFPRIRVGLLVGIGAGIPDYDNDVDIRLGDVVISSSPQTGGVVVYDFGKALADGSFESLSVLNSPPRSLGSALGKLQTEHLMQKNRIAYYIEQMLERFPLMRSKGFSHPGHSADRLFQPSYLHAAGKSCVKCDSSAEISREPRLDDSPVIHYGTIASGDMVIKDALKRDLIRDRHGAICLEMEAAGLMNNFPCIVIRGISDYADSHKNDRWQPFAAATAAACAKEFLEHVQPKAIEAEPAAKDILYQVHDDVAEIKEFVMTKQSQRILDWITELDFDRQHNDNLKSMLEGTGLWLLESEVFVRWISQPQQTLFCPGIPGAGKTIMSSIVVEHLRTKFLGDPEVQVAQLANKGSTVLPNIEQMYKSHTGNKTRPTVKEIRPELSRTAQSFRRIFVVIDALDEYCSSDPDELQDLLSALFTFQKDGPVNILATSRPNSEIMSKFKECTQREIRAQDDDILRYVTTTLPTLLRSKISLYPNVQDDVRREVVKSADGMFLLATLHMDHLKGYLTVGDLKEALDHLPRGRTRLGKAYDHAIDRIKSQYEPCCQMAMRVLSWLTHCKRALFADELQDALGIRPGHTDLDPEFLPDIDILDSVCAGLVVFDQNTSRIRLVHYTTKEYLLGHPAFRNSEVEIAQTCITYLSFEAFSSGASDYEHRRRNYSLHHYFAEYWAVHASAALDTSKEFMTFLVAFLEKKSNVYAAGQAMLTFARADRPGREHWLKVLPDPLPDHQLTKVHLAAYGGLTSIITEYIRQNQDLDIGDSKSRTPLAYAAEGGHLETTRVLLESKRVNPDSKDWKGETPLVRAAFGGYKEVVQLLIQYRACPNPTDESGHNPLCAAALCGDIETMRLLLDHGAQINQQGPYYVDSPSNDEDDGTPLMNAWCSGNKDAVLFLLERGADPNYPNKGGATILTAAARDDDEKLVKLLLERGVHVDPKDYYSTTPLGYAVQGGFLGIAKQLIKAGADVNMQNIYGQSVLMTACRPAEGRKVYRLRYHGPNPNIQDSSLETPLSMSTGHGSLGMIKVLLDNRADPNILDRDGETALFRAAETEHGDLITSLLYNNADPHVCNDAFETALFPAVKKGHDSVVNILLDAGLDVHSQDIAGNTPLFYAASSGSEEVVRLLLQKGARIDHRNALQETALFFAARYGRPTVVKLLIEAGATKDPRNLIMETPLISAAAGLYDTPFWPNKNTLNYRAVVTLLLENGVDPSPLYNPTFQSKSQFESLEVLWSS